MIVDPDAGSEPESLVPVVVIDSSCLTRCNPAVTISSSDANVQLPDVVGVNSPSSGLWKSPKSPKDSKEDSSSENDEVNAKLSLTAAESEKGPNPSWKENNQPSNRCQDEEILRHPLY